MKTIFFIICGLLFVSASCNKEPEEPTLPPLTSEGKNTFGCKINGKIFVASGKQNRNTINPKGVTYDFNPDNSGIVIWANEEIPNVADISIKINYQAGKNSYDIKNGNSGTWAYIRIPVENYVLEKSEFNTDTLYSGILNLSYFQNDIISGTFEFDAIDERGEVVHVTEGRFDISTK